MWVAGCLLSSIYHRLPVLMENSRPLLPLSIIPTRTVIVIINPGRLANDELSRVSSCSRLRALPSPHYKPRIVRLRRWWEQATVTQTTAASTREGSISVVVVIHTRHWQGFRTYRVGLAGDIAKLIVPWVVYSDRLSITIPGPARTVRRREITWILWEPPLQLRPRPFRTCPSSNGVRALLSNSEESIC